MKVGWVLTDSPETGNSSRRIAGNVHNWFNGHGIESRIVYANPGDGGIGVSISPSLHDIIRHKEITHLIFQKVCTGYAPYYLAEAKEYGIVTAYTIDDWMGDYAFQMYIHADILIANSDYMKNYVKELFNRDAAQISVAYESPKEVYKKDYTTDQVKVYWIGSFGNATQAHVLEDLVHKLGYKYEILGNSLVEGATIPWSRTYYNDMIDADIVVIPSNMPMKISELAKGKGRPIELMVLGLPIVASPFPSYLKLFKQGKNGFICHTNTLDEFEVYLSALKNQALRERIGKTARESVVDRYSMDTIGQRWLEILNGNTINKTL